MVPPARASLRPDRLRAVNAPRTVTVELDESSAPTAVGRLGGSAVGKIECINETWRIDDEWWRKIISRVYFEVMIEGGKRMVLFHDLITGNWFMQQP